MILKWKIKTIDMALPCTLRLEIELPQGSEATAPLTLHIMGFPFLFSRNVAVGGPPPVFLILTDSRLHPHVYSVLMMRTINA